MFVKVTLALDRAVVAVKFILEEANHQLHQLVRWRGVETP
jgi:hypothetical protein